MRLIAAVTGLTLILPLLGSCTAPPADTTVAKAQVAEQPRILTRVHAVPARFGSNLPAIVQAIQTRVAPGGWESGDQSVQAVDQTLIVRTTPERHAAILRYLEAMRSQ